MKTRDPKPRPLTTAAPAPAKWPRRVRVGLLAAAAISVGWLAADRAFDAYRFHSAVRAERAGDPAGASVDLAHCMRVWPDDPEVRLLSARLGWRTKLAQPFPDGWDRSARADLKVAERSPALLARAGLEADVLNALTGDLRRVEARLAARTRADGPDAVAVLEALTRAELDAHRFAAARKYAGELVRRRPDFALGHFWRGLALEMSGGEAVPDYRRAVELDPSNPDYRLALAGALLRRKGNLPEARRILDRLHAEYPDRTDVLPLYGEVLLDQGEPAAARPVVERYLAGRPRDGEALALLGRLELADDRAAEAERALRAAAAASPGSYAAHTQLAQCLVRAGKPDEAKAATAKADRIRADHDAIAGLALKAAERPADAKLRYQLGVLHLRIGDDRIGASWLESALAVDPAFEPARQALTDHFKSKR